MQNCKFCQSRNVVKHGQRAGIQRYVCKECNHHFFDNQVSFARMRVNGHAIVTALNLYFDGLSTRKVQKQLYDIFGEEVSASTVWYWIHKYSELVNEYAKTLQPKLSGKYHHDETEIKVGGEGRYFWETIDEDTRFLVAHLLGESRTSEDARKVFTQALETQRPTTLFTDGSFAYDDAFNKVYWTRYKNAKVEWVRRVGIQARETNNIIERKHGTLKDRLKPMRGFKNDKRTDEWLNGYVVNYNFCRTHSSTKMTPAQAAGIEVKGWKQLITNAQAEKTKQEIVEKKPMEIQVRA